MKLIFGSPDSPEGVGILPSSKYLQNILKFSLEDEKKLLRPKIYFLILSQELLIMIISRQWPISENGFYLWKNILSRTTKAKLSNVIKKSIVIGLIKNSERLKMLKN